jgi:lipopolysaccharide transport system permease protein
MTTKSVSLPAPAASASVGSFLRSGFPVMPLGIARHFARHRQLVRRLVERDVLGRYDGSYLGVLWAVLTPLLMLALYGFFFSVVFQARWTEGEEAIGLYVVTLYAGLITFWMFSEVVGAGPQIVVSKRSYVTKVVFPLEILPLVQTLGSAARALPSYGILALALLWQGRLSASFLFLPLVLLPVLLTALAAAYLLAFLGVFVRDLAHTMTIVIRALIYLTPVFYPVTRLPEKLRPWILLSPLARALEECRKVAIFGEVPDFWALGLASAVAAVLAWMCYVLFMSFKKAFADVL